MNEFLDYVLLDNSIRSYLLVAGIIMLAVIFKRYLSRYIAGLIFRLISRTAKGVDKKSFVDLVVQPVDIFLVILVSLGAIGKLNFPKVLDVSLYNIRLGKILETISILVLIITFIWLLLRIIDFIALILERKAGTTDSLSDNQLVVFFKDFFKVVIVIFGIVLILKFGFSYKVTSLITGLSIAGAAIALATRESIENLIASFIIFFDHPFSTGDNVKVQNITGSIEKIGLRSTRIRTDQKTYVTVPNKQMVDSILDNLSLRTHRRAFVALELSSASNTANLKEFIGAITELLKLQKHIDTSSVFLADIIKGAFVVNVEYFCYTIPVAEFNELRQDINLKIIMLMDKFDLKLASKEENNLV
jgi:MscS family membrane protein